MVFQFVDRVGFPISFSKLINKKNSNYNMAVTYIYIYILRICNRLKMPYGHTLVWRYKDNYNATNVEFLFLE